MSSKSDKNIYILVIEDDQNLREFLADQLTDRGYKVMTADNGTEAVECVRNSKFHIVVSDVRMPGMDGLQTLEAIKNIDPEIQVIMASAHGNEETVLEAMKKGAYHFLHKPIAMGEFFLLIEKAHELNKSSFPSAIKLESLLETALERLQTLFYADAGSFMLMDDSGCLYIACSKGLSEETVYLTALRLGERVAGLAAKENSEFLINGSLENYPQFHGIKENPHISSSIVVPVCCQQKLIGVLNLNRTANSQDFTLEDLKGVSIFVSQIAKAVQDAKLLLSLEEKARNPNAILKKKD